LNNLTLMKALLVMSADKSPEVELSKIHEAEQVQVLSPKLEASRSRLELSLTEDLAKKRASEALAKQSVKPNRTKVGISRHHKKGSE